MSVVEFVLIVVNILGLVRCDFVHRPSNSEAVVGGEVELRCATFAVDGSFSIEWQHTPVGHTRPETVNKKDLITGACGSRCVVRGNEIGEYNLFIKELTLYDAGKYTCMDVQHSHTADAELVVFDTYPSPQSCAAVLPSDGAVGQNSCGIEPDMVQLSCNMSYSGNLKPFMEWTSSDGSLKTADRSRIGVSVRADLMQDSSYTCRIRYENSDFISKYSWTTSIRVFSNQTTEVSVSNCKSTQTINCSVSTGHSCSYSWTSITRVGSQKMYSGPILDLSKKVPTGLYICKALCSVRGITCPVEPVQVDYCFGSKKDGLSPGAIAAIVISIVLFMIFITIFLLVMFLRKRLAGDNNNDGACPPNNDIQLPFIEKGEPKVVPGGSGQTESLGDLTGDKPDILGHICEKDEQIAVEPDEATSSDIQSHIVTSPTVPSKSDSGSEVAMASSDPDLSGFVVVDVNEDSIQEKVEYRFPGK